MMYEQGDPAICKNDFLTMLIRLAMRFQPSTIIDVGASDGRWSSMAHEVWPDANLLLIEANPVFEPALWDFNAGDPSRRHIVMKLAGGDSGTESVRFALSDPYQGVYRCEKDTAGMVAIERVTIDDTVFVRNLPGPYLIKLDTHGRESEILAGARRTLRHTGAIVAEVYTWSQGASSMRAADLVPLIEMVHGFLPSDLCEPLRRPLDGRLVQVDMMFEPKGAAGMDTARYR